MNAKGKIEKSEKELMLILSYLLATSNSFYFYCGFVGLTRKNEMKFLYE
jgi:hypothetical protein